MLILGYAFGLRSERLLCREVRVNLAYRWFCGLREQSNTAGKAPSCDGFHDPRPLSTKKIPLLLTARIEPHRKANAH
jgi:hypothetical protein